MASGDKANRFVYLYHNVQVGQTLADTTFTGK